MITRYYLDTRQSKDGAPSVIKLSITHNRSVRYISTQFKVLPEQWDPVKQEVKKHPQRLAINLTLSKQKIEIDNYLYERARDGFYDGRDASYIRDDINRYLKPKDDGKKTFFSVFDMMMNEVQEGTKTTYRAIKKRMLAFDKKAEELSFDDMDEDWMKSFLASCDVGNNTKLQYVGKMKKAFTYARRKKITTNDPFLDIKIKSTPSRHRDLSRDDIIKIRDMELSGKKDYARDIFMLMFYLIGINIKDLYHLDKDSMKDGRIIYIRYKTGKRYSIPVEPEAMELINKHKGEKGLIDLSDKWENHRTCTGEIDRYLRMLFTGLSTYYSRHTWSTFAHKCRIPKDYISICLGHSLPGAFITDVYIDYDDDIIDECSRKVLDYIK